MIEDELREVFADHEGLAPPAAPLIEAMLKGLAAITDPARLSRVLAGSGTVSLSMSTGLPGPGDLSEALAGIRTAAGIVEPAGADRTELFRDLAADRLDAYLAAHPS